MFLYVVIILKCYTYIYKLAILNLNLFEVQVVLEYIVSTYMYT
jgi:hypothetical protein